MTTRTLEDRVAIVEQELERVKQQLQANTAQESEPRWKQIIGVFKDDPLFDEAERLGREWREATHGVRFGVIPRRSLCCWEQPCSETACWRNVGTNAADVKCLKPTVSLSL